MKKNLKCDQTFSLFRSNQIFQFQLNKLPFTPGFLLLQWATLDVCHSPVAIHHEPWCSTQNLLKPVKSSEKPSALIFPFHCMDTFFCLCWSRHDLQPCSSFLCLPHLNPCRSYDFFFPLKGRRFVSQWNNSDGSFSRQICKVSHLKSQFSSCLVMLNTGFGKGNISLSGLAAAASDFWSFAKFVTWQSQSHTNWE